MNLKEATEIVCKNRPELARIIKENASTSVCSYYKDTSTAENCSDSLLIEIITDIARERNIDVGSDSIKKTLVNSFRVGTADHHGPLGHPFFFHNTLMEKIIAREHEAIILLPCAGISLDNSSFPRGVLFHAADGTLLRIPFFPSSKHREPVYAMKVSTQAMREYAQRNISKNNQIFSQEIKNKLSQIIESILPENETITYEVALSRINERLWNIVDSRETSVITIDQESVVAEYICRSLSKDKMLDALLTNADVQKSFLKHFNGVIGAFDSEKNTGTHLFWYRTEHTREQMYLKQNILVTHTGNKVFLTSEGIIEALKTKKMYPSMALSFIILCEFEGLRTDGGFSQVNYLKEILERYDEVVKDANGPLNKRRHKIHPSIFRGEITIAPFALGDNTVQATLLDLILYAPTDWKTRIKAYSEKLSLTDSIYGMMESFYKITTGQIVQLSDAPVPEPLWHVTTETTKK
jgi:hypothetical protein